MRIGMILPGRFPPDIRVEKELTTLCNEHEVFLLCPRRDGQPVLEEWHGMQIHRVFTRAERWWSQWNLMVRCHSGAWQKAIEDFIAATNVDALHVHDLPLLGAALRAARRQAIPVVADLHENYPAMLEQALQVPLSRLTSLGSLASRLSVSVRRWREYEKSAVAQADRVIVVVEEARDRLAGLGVPAGTISVVGNYALLDSLQDPGSPEAHALRPGDNPLRVVYAGDFGPTRDLRTVLESVSALPDEVRRSFEVQLIGGQGRDLMQLRRFAEKLGIEEYVSLLQWIPRAEAESMMLKADVGLVPHVKSAHTDATIPHKLFQYMWRRLPVIVSNCAPLQRIVEETGCGYVYESGDSRSLAARLSEVSAQRERMGKMGADGHDAVARKYNWDNAGKSLLNVYRELA